MSYTYAYTIALGSTYTGTVLGAQLYNISGSVSGSPIYSGFTELDFGGNSKGNYQWVYAGFGDTFRGSVAFFSSGSSTTLASAPINPEYNVGYSVWTYSGTKQLTTPITGNGDSDNLTNLSKTRGDDWEISPTGLGSLVGYTSVWFSMKDEYIPDDLNATVKIVLNASGTGNGLIRLNKSASPDATWGSITIDDAANGNITITLSSNATKLLKLKKDYVYDIQFKVGSTVSTPQKGEFEVSGDVTRDTS